MDKNRLKIELSSWNSEDNLLAIVLLSQEGLPILSVTKLPEEKLSSIASALVSIQKGIGDLANIKSSDYIFLKFNGFKVYTLAITEDIILFVFGEEVKLSDIRKRAKLISKFL